MSTVDSDVTLTRGRLTRAHEARHDANLREVQDSTDALRARNSALERRLFDHQALLKASEALHNELDVEALCEVALAMFAERTSAGTGAVLVYNEATEDLTVLTVAGLAGDAEAVRIPLREGILWRLLLAGEPFPVTGSGGDLRFPDVFGRYGVEHLKSRLWVPLTSKGALVGVIALGQLQESDRDAERTAADQEFLEELGAQTAAAISTARLYSEVVGARRDLDRSLHNLSMLFDVSRALAAVSDLSKLLHLILDRAVDAVDADSGSLMLLDEATDLLSVRVVTGLDDPSVARRIEAGEIQCAQFARGDGVAGQVLATGKPMRVDDTTEDEVFVDREGCHARTLLCLPLTVDGTVIGVLNVTNQSAERAFDDDDLELLEAMASQAAIAITRMRLYEMAIRDDLTGLLLRRYIMNRLRQELRRAIRYGDDLTVMMCDIDKFKRINDTYGHAAGDAVLVEVAEHLANDLRTEVDLPARWGGEEFLVVMPKVSALNAHVAANRLRKRIASSPVELPDGAGQVTVTMSFGLASLTKTTRDIETAEYIIKCADDALYSAKRTGRNRVVVWRPPEPAAGSSGAVAPAQEEENQAGEGQPPGATQDQSA